MLNESLETKTNELEFKMSDDWIRFKRENPWAIFIPEYAEDKDGKKYMRKKGSNVVYKMNIYGKNSYTCVCNACDSEIMAERVAHPIWDGPFPCSGSGKCQSEFVPYCPKCEEKPKSNGSPIIVSDD